MSRLYLLLLFLGVATLGCSSTEPTATDQGSGTGVADMSDLVSPTVDNDVATTPDAAESSKMEPDDDSFTAAPPDMTGEPAAEGETPLEDTTTLPAELTTANHYMQAIGQKVQPPTQDIPAAIALAEEGLAKLPEDQDMMKLYASLLYQTLRFETDETVANARRLKLGTVARTLIDLNKDNMEALGQMPAAILLEEAKAHLSSKDTAKAWDTILAARQHGFTQTEFLFFDPAFAPIVENEKALAKIKGWLSDEIAAQIASQESYPFDFTLKSTEGADVSLADYRGKLVIVDFWGTWCPPCRETIPHLVDLAEERKDSVVILGINIEDPQSADDMPVEQVKLKLDEFEANYLKINYTCLAGTQATVEQVPGFQGFPTMLLIDGQGRVRLQMTGYRPKVVLEAAIDQLMKDASQG